MTNFNHRVQTALRGAGSEHPASSNTIRDGGSKLYALYGSFAAYIRERVRAGPS